jgi:microcystin-dependent protein
MPRDANGVYSLPPIYLAATGETIEALQHNSPLEDLAKGLTDSLPRNGAAAMTGALKIIDGTATNPALRFASSSNIGFFKTANGIGVSVNGVKVAEFTAQGIIGATIGTPIPLLDDVLPDGCVWADGRNVSRSTYAALYAKWADKYGAGDGSTTFGIVDMRGRGLIGRDNIGGTDSSRLVGVPVVSGSRLITGSILGAALQALLLTHMPNHAHPGGTTDLQGLHIHGYGDSGGGSAQRGSLEPAYTSTSIPGDVGRATDSAGIHGHNVFLPAQGDGTPHNNVQSSIACNWAIYAGA